MDEGIVEGGEDVGYTEYKFTFSDLRAKADDFLFLDYLFLRRLCQSAGGMTEIEGSEGDTIMKVSNEELLRSCVRKRRLAMELFVTVKCDIFLGSQKLG